MKQILSIVFVILTLLAIVVLIFTIQQVNQEQQSLSLDLEHRSALLADTLKDNVEPYVANDSENYLQKTVDKFTNRERIIGLVIYDNKDNILALSTGLSAELAKQAVLPANTMDADEASGTFMTFNNKNLYLYAIPLHDKDTVIGSMMVVENANYINSTLWDIWKRNIIRLLTQASLISFAVLLILYWIIAKPIVALVEVIKNARMGKVGKTENLPKHLFFQPLINEVSRISKSLHEARTSASLEARLRLEKIDSPWTAERLKEFTKDTLKGKSIYVVSNREPYIHTKQGGKTTFFQPASGMVTAIEPIMRACGGMWIAHGSGDADKTTVNENDIVQVPPDDPKYSLKRVWLSKEEEKGYYYGFSNEGLWPLCHNAHTRPLFRKEDWIEYQRVNGKFAQVLLKEIKDIHRPIILVQDFHFALLPRIIRNSRPDAIIGIFWHIPWPHSESFRICPWRKEILEGMLGADIIGFHTQLHCNNFIDTIGHELEALVDLEQFAIQKEGHVSYVKPFPISIPFLEDEKPDAEKLSKDREQLRKDLNIKTKYMGIGVDRLDYTKGILERLQAVEYFLQTYPNFKNEFTFVQIAAPSRSSIPHYAQFAEKVEKEVERINTLFKTNDWKPIVLLKKHHSHEEIYRYYKASDVCLVTSLHDGMNLVAKEFIMSRNDEKGVLVLSQFAGASRELKDALIVNPYNIEQTANAIHTSLTMMQTEQTKRMKKLRETVKNYNVYRWSADLLRALINVE